MQRRAPPRRAVNYVIRLLIARSRRPCLSPLAPLKVASDLSLSNAGTPARNNLTDGTRMKFAVEGLVGNLGEPRFSSGKSRILPERCDDTRVLDIRDIQFM